MRKSAVAVDGIVSLPRFPDTCSEVASAVRKDVLMPTPHSPEFRQRAVELARQGVKSVGKIAKDLGISESCLRNWMAQAHADESGSAARLTSAEKKELAELRRKNRVLAEILIRTGQAACWYS